MKEDGNLLRKTGQEKSRYSIACIGECMVEFRGEMFGQLMQSWGGDTINTAVYLRRLLPESFRVSYVTAVGQDVLSDKLVSFWNESGIETGNVKRIGGKSPGAYQIFVDGNGERSFSYWRSHSAAKYCFDNLSVDQLAMELSEYDCVYFSGITVAVLTDVSRRIFLEALSLYKSNGGFIVFDSNYRPALWRSIEESQSSYLQIKELADLVFLTNDDEQRHFALNDPDAIFSHWDCNEVVVKYGAQPCLVKTQNERLFVAASVVDNVADTTAAGDSFAAGYLAGKLSGLSSGEAAQLGHKLASVVIQHHGAIIDSKYTQHLYLGGQ